MATKSVEVKATVRQQLGSRANKRLRDKGMLPAVIYGHKEAVVPVTLPRKEVVTHIDKGAHLFALHIDGKPENVLVKEVQYDHLGLEVLHVDFARVNLDEKVKVTIPLEFRGSPIGEKEGGKLQTLITDLEVECLVTDIPDSVRVNVEALALNQSLHVRELKLPANVRAIPDGELIVAIVKAVVEVATDAAAVAEGTAEPELIRKPKPEEGAAAAGAAPAKDAKK